MEYERKREVKELAGILDQGIERMKVPFTAVGKAGWHRFGEKIVSMDLTMLSLRCLLEKVEMLRRQLHTCSSRKRCWRNTSKHEEHSDRV